jgi:Domain of unknown function (DUF4145)
MPISLSSALELDRCPHCSIDKPFLRVQQQNLQTANHLNQNQRLWSVYACARCGGMVLAAARGQNDVVIEYYPRGQEVNSALPEKARAYLKQAHDSLHAPAGAVMLAASTVDAMLKAKGYKKGSLYDRIEQAVKDHLITKEMGEWAHKVRLDSNDQRHADEEATLPDEKDARRSIEFATALGQFMFVLPALVEKGLKETDSA